MWMTSALGKQTLYNLKIRRDCTNATWFMLTMTIGLEGLEVSENDRKCEWQEFEWCVLSFCIFYARVLPLGLKLAPRRLLRKTSNLFLFNCKPERIDNNDFKDSNFEDNGQPEIAIWPHPNRKHLYLRKYDRYQNSNGKSKIFDHGELEEYL